MRALDEALHRKLIDLFEQQIGIDMEELPEEFARGFCMGAKLIGNFHIGLTVTVQGAVMTVPAVKCYEFAVASGEFRVCTARNGQDRSLQTT